MSLKTDIEKLLKYYGEISELELRNYARENNIEPDILLKIIKNAKDKEAIDLAKKFIKFGEDEINKLKKYL